MQTFQTKRSLSGKKVTENEITPRGHPWFSHRSRWNDQECYSREMPTLNHHEKCVLNIYWTKQMGLSYIRYLCENMVFYRKDKAHVPFVLIAQSGLDRVRYTNVIGMRLGAVKSTAQTTYSSSSENL